MATENFMLTIVRMTAELAQTMDPEDDAGVIILECDSEIPNDMQAYGPYSPEEVLKGLNLYNNHYDQFVELDDQMGISEEFTSGAIIVFSEDTGGIVRINQHEILS